MGTLHGFIETVDCVIVNFGLVLCSQNSCNNTLQWRHNGRDSVSNNHSRLFTRPFIQAQIKANVKAPRHWPLVTSPHKLPVPRKCFQLMTSSWFTPPLMLQSWFNRLDEISPKLTLNWNLARLRIPITLLVFVQSFWNFAQSMVV